MLVHPSGCLPVCEQAYACSCVPLCMSATGVECGLQVERTKYTEKRAQVLQECAKRTLEHVEHTKWLQVTATEAIVELVKELQKEILVANEEAANAHTTLDRIRASENAGLLLRRVERLRMKEWTERMQVKEWDSLVAMHHANANSFTSMVEYVGKQKTALTLPQ